MPTIIVKSRLGIKFEPMTVEDYKSYKALQQWKREKIWDSVRHFVDNYRARNKKGRFW